MKGPERVTQADIQRVLSAMRAFGMEPEEILIRPNEVRLKARSASNSSGASSDVLDEISRHFGNGKR